MTSFAFLFVPLTTAALSNIPRHELAGAAGVNSFVRQVGGSIGLSIFANLFTTYSRYAAGGLAQNVSVLRPEVAAGAGALKASLMARGLTGDVRQRRARKAYLILGTTAAVVAGLWLGHRWLSA